MNSQELLEKLHGLLEELTAEHAKGSKVTRTCSQGCRRG